MLAASSTIMDLKLVNNLEERKESLIGDSVTRTIYYCKKSNELIIKKKNLNVRSANYSFIFHLGPLHAKSQ